MWRPLREREELQSHRIRSDKPGGKLRMSKPKWLVEASEIIPEIMKVAEKCDEPYKQKCFEILLSHALRAEGVQVLRPDQPGGVAVPVSVGVASRKFDMFLKQNNWTVETIGNLVDLESGEILTMGLGSKRTEVQRKLAVLVAIHGLCKHGELIIPRDHLKKSCVRQGVYDQANFSKNMRTARIKNSVVFVEDASGWKVTGPGEAFVVDTLKELLKSVG